MRNTFQVFPFLFILLFFIPLISCVSKKKFLTEVSNKMACDSTLQDINSHNMQLNREIAGLKLELAEKTGEASAFREVLDKQDVRIDDLQAEIRKLTSQSLSFQELTDGALEMKKLELAERDSLVQSFKNAILAQEEVMKELIGKVASQFNEYGSEELNLYVRKGFGHIVFAENLIFKKGTTNITREGFTALENIANILYQYPRMDILVIGHTDSQPVRKRNLKDNWDLSVLRATPIVRTLTKEYGLNPNQVTAGGKGDSKPQASNDSKEGREQNRRTEIVIIPPTDRILKLIMDSE